MDLEQKISKYIHGITTGLLTIIIILILFHILWPRAMFNMDKENNLPSWFSSILLFTASLAAIVNYILYKEDKDGIIFNKPWTWLIISAIFIFFSFDESSCIHERIAYASWDIFPSLKSFSDLWLLVYIPVLISCLLLIKDLFMYLREYQKSTFKFIIIGIIFWGIAVSLELAGQGYLKRFNILYNSEIVLEESFEMLSSLFFIVAFLDSIKIKLLISLNKHLLLDFMHSR